MLKRLFQVFIVALLPLLAGCDFVVMSPSGDIAAQQRDLIVVSTVLMLLIIIPVLFLIFYFAWHYRRTNTAATYDPEWHHSTRLEVVIWSAPLAIIIALGAVTWISTHKLDPYRPLDRLDADRPVPADAKPLTVEVVALDWKWLFFYPDLGIATVNELAAPVDVPINFKLTATSVMNSFYIPALAGQIYAMPGMETKLHAVINKEGEYKGFSANYSGLGFSNMYFKFHGMTQQGFDDWVARVKTQGTALNRDAYLRLEKPSEKEPVRYYASADKDLYKSILNLCAQPGKMCTDEMMHIDRMGGAGKESLENREKLEYDNRRVEKGEMTNSPTFPASGEPSRSPEEPNKTVNDNGGQPMQHDMNNMPGMQHGEPSAPAPDSGSSNPAPTQLNNNN
ncbi:ubiquinol oxidase subunit II [Neorhizobium lilium]|nr:ubiquinol oxidase subunit II [Neorhizobium lilium]